MQNLDRLVSDNRPSAVLTAGIRVNVTAAERAHLERVAADQDRSIAAVVRLAIRRYLATA
jgi:hypothetical protein